MPLPFGIKTPSKGTLIFGTVVGTISGLIYNSNNFATDSRKRLVQRVSYLADKPCDVHEFPRKVTVYISAPPGDGLEKSRNWFREYVKPVLVAGAVDYEVKEAREAGQIESSVIEEVIKRRRETAERQNGSDESFGQPEEINLTKSQYSTGMVDVLEAKKTKDVSDGILAIGRNAYREVMDGLAKGCDASLEVVEEPKIDQVAEKVDSNNVNSTDENTATEQTISESTNNELILNDDTPQQEEGEVVSHFSLPDSFLPVVYVPQVNIIGWSNIPYRLYMWYADYKRIDDVGKYVVAAVLNETRPMEERDANKGEQEKKYWIGEESAEELKKNDQPIKIDDRIIGKLRTFTSEDLP